MAVMKTRDFIAISKQLLPSLPGMVVHNGMMLAASNDAVLRGICFEGSSFDAGSFYVWSFGMQLYVPADGINFNLGVRLRMESGAERWHQAEDQLIVKLSNAVRIQAVPMLRQLETAAGVVELTRAAASVASGNPHLHRELAFALAKAGENEAALGELEVLSRRLDRQVPWQNEIARSSEALHQCLIADPEGVPALLKQWVAENVHRLGLNGVLQV